MKPRARARLVVPFALFVGCDPGITIRQINSTADSKKKTVVVTPEITIQVKTTHQLIGDPTMVPEQTDLAATN
jgi:hypothetical protein